ncbi:MAG: flagellar basal body protein [Limimaricola soesokkakensis]|uniref:flagellar basal body protein n=1 Tax=Limimaricola soesokkakensis TaxID=1343159 RepID=UPI0040580CAD
MYQSINLFDAAATLARRSGTRAAVIAANIANADTPGFRAQAVDDVAAETGSGVTLRRSRPGHLGGTGTTEPRLSDRPGPAAPNGNTVSLETEMMAAAAARSDHGRALAVYRHAMGVIRSSLGGR